MAAFPCGRCRWLITILIGTCQTVKAFQPLGFPSIRQGTCQAIPLPRALIKAVASADMAAELEVPSISPRTPGQAIRGLYEAFNERDAEKAGAFLAEDCVYEDLLLGPATICRGREAFTNALRYHPAFVAAGLKMPFGMDAPAIDIRLIVDSVAEGKDTVGIEWHVEIGGAMFPLGRGLTQATVSTETGEITRVVDIAEAPWRVIGVFIAPFLGAFATVKIALALCVLYVYYLSSVPS